ncbi:hypothetical protein LOC67_10850 [Stieleria sp. JC731]|uniref:hypothetical protein n=1 Tax=Pirellulaceae TaxID=2691357 RepID=UPI001E2D1704|nr:hypothetical protein [Stieleria sp. JC731]MCC9601044.1 hypothetical protein [Stieleria sp. JC731]
MKTPSILIPMMLLAIVAGCPRDKDTRLIEMAQRHEIRQAEQNVRAAELQREVAAMQREVQSERSKINQERDQLEDERRDIASSRRFDSLSAAAITSVGLIFACLLPLGLIWLLLTSPQDALSDQAMVNLMIDDMVADRPMLFDRSDTSHRGRLLDTTTDPQEPK